MICYGPRMTETRRWIALVVLCVGMLMIILDSTVVNVALPSIGNDLHFSQASLAWVVNAYLISFGGLLLLSGRLGDLFGRRRIFLGGLALFTVSSAVCGLADSQWLLIGARFIQGVGGALTSAVILGMIVTMFPAPHEQGKAIGVYSFVASGGASIGLLAGGVLTQALNWHWIFFINVPIGIATWIATRRLIAHEAGAGAGGGLDSPGALLIVGALMALVYAILGASSHGWTSAQTLGIGALAIMLFVGFIWREGSAKQPLMPLRILRSRVPASANLVQMLGVAGLFGMFFLGALYLQRVLGYGAIDVGLAFLPVSLGIGVLSLGFTARISMRIGARSTLLTGLVLIAAGLALFARAPVGAGYLSDLLPAMVLLGVGAGLMFPVVMMLAMAGADASDSGLLSGLANTSQQMGGALGLAVLASLASSRTSSLVGRGATQAHALTSGYHLAYVVAASLVTVAVPVAAVLLRPSAAAAPAVVSVSEHAEQLAPAAERL